ncbi:MULTISPECIES: group II intron reverse transcriptase/maturase [Methylobacterium]|uniref:group II intron reverse transcriptase/maturase n=1 Tax=Methylobacterium TaxID=407 RepID=UPI00272E3517|nr:group II intron reverse transcriptase/maturase [Methylobacterium sp.]
MQSARRQMPARAGRSEPVRGEASRLPGSDEAGGPRHAPGAMGPGLLDAALARENVQRAWRRVKANKGAAGVDGLDIAQTAALLRTAWPEIRDQVLSGTYRPQPVRCVAIPKPGGGERELGIPTVTDRLIQQALLQVLQPLLDPHFSEHSYGYRPGRGAQDAVLAAQACVQAGRRVVVDVDLAQFFDRVNHDILIDRLQKRIGDAGVIRLIRAYLTSGIMKGGVVRERGSGTPQGGPLSPLLANVLLDEVDRELEQRGHHFVRYTDDVTVYVRSRKAGARVMDVLRGLLGRLKLSLNEAKSAVRSAFGCVVLGFTFWVAPGGVVKRRVASASLGRFKRRVRDLTRRSGGRSLPAVVGRLRTYLLGWKGYYRLAQTPKVWRELDGWVRHRVRAIQLKQWKRGPTIYRALLALGAKPEVALPVAANSRRWWRNSGMALNGVLTLAWMDKLGLPRLA